MRVVKHVGGLAAILLAAQIAVADSKPAEELAGLKREAEQSLARVREPGPTEAERKEASDRYAKEVAVLARRALELAETYPDAPEAPQALVWVIERSGAGAERDAAYDRLAGRYLEKEILLPLIGTACYDCDTAHSQAFLRAAVERSSNLKVRALACFSLGRYHQELARLVRGLNHPTGGKVLQTNLGPETANRIRSLQPEALKREAGALLERTIREFADLRPMGKDYPPLGEQAAGALFQLRNLDLGCTIPEIEGEDINGKPMRLSDYRGKVILISFWAIWCAPCMALVPSEKALVERMKGRPFVLIGVSGDDDREKAKAVSAKEGVTWRSFWEGGPQKGVPVKWGVRSWPTVYLVDAKGVIRDDGIEYFRDLRSPAHYKTIEALVAEAEMGGKKQ